MLCCARIVCFQGALVAGAILATQLPAAETASATPNRGQKAARQQIVGLFAGIEAGRIEARVIPRNERHVNLLLENRTPEPLTVSIPAALAAAPVLAQFGEFPWPPAEGDRGRQQPQKVGLAPPWQGPQGPGPMNLPGGGGPWNIPIGGLWSIPPETVVKVRLTGVCLDHGLPTPRPKIPYELRPIEQVTDRPEVAAICIMASKGDIDQEMAQLAAWHFQNELSWQELATRRDKAAIGTVPTYSQKQIRSAKRFAEQAKRLAKEIQDAPVPVSMR